MRNDEYSWSSSVLNEDVNDPVENSYALDPSERDPYTAVERDVDRGGVQSDIEYDLEQALPSDMSSLEVDERYLLRN